MTRVDLYYLTGHILFLASLERVGTRHLKERTTIGSVSTEWAVVDVSFRAWLYVDPKCLTLIS